VVFSSLLDLNAHQVRIHGETMTGKQKKDKMRVEAGFAFEDIRNASARSQPIAPRNSGNSGGLAIFTRRAVFGDTLTAGSNELGSSPGNVVDVAEYPISEFVVSAHSVTLSLSLFFG
jgi:hypothetical protein